MMKTPVCDFINNYIAKKGERLHMPGHKGAGAIGCEAYDLTEISGADVLADPKGIISESQANAAALFGAAKTAYFTEGATSAIKSMLFLAVAYAGERGEKPYILAARNAHKAFLSAAIELDFDFEWLTSGLDTLITQNVTPETLENGLLTAGQKPTAVYVTSPDYLGNMLDVKGLASVCKEHGALLLVDNAHGAYLNFLKDNKHPLYLGADMCCDSAHKTLPCLTGGAYLHINSAVNEVIGGYLPQAASLFTSTSPSWLTLYSLDKLNDYLAGDYRERLNDYIKRVDDLKAWLKEKGFELLGGEPLKVTVAPKSFGYKGVEVADILSKGGTEVEFSDGDHVVMMFTPENGYAVFDTLKKSLDIKRRDETYAAPPAPVIPKRAMRPREAYFALSEQLPVNDAIGRVFSSCALSCPPAVPVITAGEVIDENTLKLFEYYGIKTCRVVKTQPSR